MSFDILGVFRPTLGKIRDRRVEIDAEVARLTAQRTELLVLPLPFDDFRAFILEQLEHQAGEGLAAFKRTFTATRTHPNHPLANVSAGARFLGRLSDDYAGEEQIEALYDTSKGAAIALLNPGAPHLTTGPVSQAALLAILGPAIREGVSRMLEEQVRPMWPAEVGLPRAERLSRAAKLTAKIDALLEEKSRIEQELRNMAAEFNGATTPDA